MIVALSDDMDPSVPLTPDFRHDSSKWANILYKRSFVCTNK
jgi:hypothetical protein